MVKIRRRRQESHGSLKAVLVITLACILLVVVKLSLYGDSETTIAIEKSGYHHAETDDVAVDTGGEDHSSAREGDSSPDVSPDEKHDSRDVDPDTNSSKDHAIHPDGGGAPITIGYAVSITGCGSDPITEGAAVLAHSIRRAQSDKYKAKLYAIYHPDAKACAETITPFGYELLERDVFVSIDDIKGENLRNIIGSSGCCGEKELIKLEAYSLTQHPIVVHLDLDVLVLKPLDDLFDRMLNHDTHPYQHDMWADKPIPSQINAFFTYDYNTVHPRVQYKPVQGGFLVLRPDQKVYEEFRDIVLEGDFRKGGGWGGKVGPFYGAPTFQGIIPYYYDVLHPNEAVELNRCVYNNMADNPTTEKTKGEELQGLCRTGQSMEECEDCRNRPLTDIYTFHYTICYKPWTCSPHAQDSIKHRLCRAVVHEWFKTRSDMEFGWNNGGKYGKGQFDRDQFYGYCDRPFSKGYLPITGYGK